MRDRERPLPVDTMTAPHEPAVKAKSTVGTWVVVLAGPAVWIAHFFVVYLAAEASCAAEPTQSMSFIGADGTEVLIVIATAVAMTMVLVAGLVARRRAGESAAPGLYRIGALMSWLFAAAIFLVGIPIFVLPVC